MKASRGGLISIVLFAAIGDATANPDQPLPALWSGKHGWTIKSSSRSVLEGERKVGDVLIEYDASLARTGVIAETIRVEAKRDGELVIPEGSKVFATNFSDPVDGVDPIDWCAYLPEGAGSQHAEAQVICIVWQNDQQASYVRTTSDNGLAFMPRLQRRSEIKGIAPKIQERPVNFGMQFKHQIRISKLDKKGLSLEKVFTDGSNTAVVQTNRYAWNANQAVNYRVDDAMVTLKASNDYESVVAATPVSIPSADSPNEIGVVLDLLVGLDGTIKEGRLVESSGNAKLDKAALEQAMSKWKMKPGMENGEPAEMWSRFKIKFKLNSEPQIEAQH